MIRGRHVPVWLVPLTGAACRSGIVLQTGTACRPDLVRDEPVVRRPMLAWLLLLFDQARRLQVPQGLPDGALGKLGLTGQVAMLG